MPAKLKLDLYNVNSDRLPDEVDVILHHTVLHQTYEEDDLDAAKRIPLDGIDSSQGGRYVLRIEPKHHRSVFRIIRVREAPDVNLEEFVLPVHPQRVTGKFPAYADLQKDLRDVLSASKVEGYDDLKGAALYKQLDDLSKAGLLNIYTKMKATVLLNGRDVFSYVTDLRRIRGDRFFARVTTDLRDHVKNSVLHRLFHEAPAGLHTPPPGFKPGDSYKTFDLYGNLQLTFFSNTQKLEFIVDTDIDDAQGIDHIFQVVEHGITHHETHPYDIHEILIYHQNLYPGYDLET